MDRIGESFGGYRLVSHLGEGGMGAVYVGEHESLGRRAAIKVLHSAFATRGPVLRRFLNEARAANLFRHPDIIEVYDFGQQEDGTAWIVMELLEGESLAHRLSREGALSTQEACTIADRVAAALQAAHDRGIVHRDLKPDNIFLLGDESGDPIRIKVVDFGIAKMAMGSGAQTQTGTILGTPAYMSPEQCDGSPGLDHRSDVYSLGVVLYEMLCGRPPFQAPAPARVAVMHITELPTPPREINDAVPADVEQVVLHALSKKKDQRPPDMTALRESLAATGNVRRQDGVSAHAPLARSTLVTGTTTLPPRAQSNIVPESTAFVGRTDELQQVLMAWESGAGLVTLTGPAGIGKSRIVRRAAALRVATGTQVRYCDVSEADTPGDLVCSVAEALALPCEQPRAQSAHVAALARALASHEPCLLVLDGLDAPSTVWEAVLAAWNDRPGVDLLVARRSPLFFSNEAVVAVGPLRPVDARNLLRQRMGGAGTGDAPDDATVDALAEAVGRSPLALELLAPRVGHHGAEVLEALRQRPSVARSGEDAEPEGEPPIAAMVSWAREQLRKPLRDTLSQCSVFRGGFTADAATEVVDLSRHEDAPAVSSALGELRACGLLHVLQPVEAPRELRFRLPGGVWALADAKLGGGVVRNALEGRHAEHYVRFAERWYHEIHGREGRLARRRLDRERWNLLEAHQRFVDFDRDTGIRAALAFANSIEWTGPFDVRLEVLAAAAAAADESVSRVLTANVTLAHGEALVAAGELDAAAPVLETALARCREASARALEGRVHDALGALQRARGNTDAARWNLEEALEIHHGVGDLRAESWTRARLGLLFHDREQLADARDAFERAMSVLRDLDDVVLEIHALSALGRIQLDGGDTAEARRSIERALDGIRRHGVGTAAETSLLVAQVDLRLAEEDAGGARELLNDALLRANEAGDLLQEARALLRSGIMSLHLEEPGQAALVLETAAKAAREALAANVEALCLAAGAAAEATLGHLDAAHSRLSEARHLAGATASAQVTAMIDAIAGLVELGAARRLQGRGDPDAARAARARAAQRLAAAQELCATSPRRGEAHAGSGGLRGMVRLLRRGLDGHGDSPGSPPAQA